MNRTDRIVDDVRAAVEALPAPPPGDVDAVVRRGRKRRALRRGRVAAAGTALLAAVASVAVIQLPRPEAPDVAPPEVEELDRPVTGDDPGLPEDDQEGAHRASDCSAAGLDPDLAQQDLPPAVEQTRQQLVDAAVACDYEALERLAATSSGFEYSFGGGDDPAGYWRRREDDGEPVLAYLVGVLELGHGIIEPGDVPGQVYAWPEVFTFDDPSRDDFASVVDSGLYDDADVDGWMEIIGGYTGYRVGIDESGTWRFFVAGD